MRAVKPPLAGSAAWRFQRLWSRLVLPRFDSLQARMALIMGAVLIPAVAYSIWQALDAYASHTERLSETIRSTARLVSAYETEFFERTRTMLEELGRTPEVGGLGGPECSPALDEFVRRWPDYGAAVALDSVGVIVCSTQPESVGLGLGDRAWFQRLSLGQDVFSISEMLVTRFSGEHTIVVGTAIRHPDTGAFAGALGATVQLRLLTPESRIGALPGGSVIVLLDQNGAPVLRGDAQDEARELAIPDGLDPSYGARSFVAVGRDGVQRMYARSDIAWGRLKVLIGVPTGGRFSWLRQDLIAGVFVPSLMLILALAAIWVATNRLVNRHVKLLARTARAYSAGRLDARPYLEGAPVELAQLGAVFAGMADRIGEREAELMTSLAQKEALLREIHHRVKNNLQIVTSLLNLRLRSIQVPEARRVLLDVQTRIKTLALVHRNLYEQEQVGSIELQHFLGELGQLLMDSAEPVPGSVELEVEVAPTRLPTDKAMAVALMVTECVTNALKHAFPDGRDGTIRVSLQHHGGRGLLVIADDGIGLCSAGANTAHGEGATQSETLGLTLCRMLAKQ
ncbi:MAG TPA: histidine kinase dimerization/phosphoacceptor domain -containing protein, partial [Geminicoccaceae bacterium]|nr:histidine kinase dimerization/phosphoacceptor domain -containing protein [Geminicoccaceae bacterium]